MDQTDRCSTVDRHIESKKLVHTSHPGNVLYMLSCVFFYIFMLVTGQVCLLVPTPSHFTLLLFLPLSPRPLSFQSIRSNIRGETLYVPFIKCHFVSSISSLSSREILFCSFHVYTQVQHVLMRLCTRFVCIAHSGPKCHF